MTAMLSHATIFGISGPLAANIPGQPNRSRNFNGFIGGVIVCVGHFLDAVSHRMTVATSIGASMFASRESAAAPADAVDAGEHAGRGHRIAKAPLHAGPCEQPQEHGPVWAPALGSQRARK